MKKNREPMRRCVGCMESKPKNELIRFAYYEDELSIDSTGKAKGRGVYLCKSRECLEKALKKKSLQRSLRTEISEADLEKVLKELEDYEG